MDNAKVVDIFLQNLLPKGTTDPDLSTGFRVVITWLVIGKEDARKISEKAVKSLENSKVISMNNEHIMFQGERDGCFVYWLFRAVFAACGISIPPVDETKFYEILTTP